MMVIVTYIKYFYTLYIQCFEYTIAIIPIVTSNHDNNNNTIY